MKNGIEINGKLTVKADYLKQLREDDKFINAFGVFVKGRNFSYDTVKRSWLYGNVPHILTDINNILFIAKYLAVENFLDLLEDSKELTSKIVTERVGTDL
jgi:hypothetical protein